MQVLLNKVITKLLCFDVTQRRYDYGFCINKSKSLSHPQNGDSAEAAASGVTSSNTPTAQMELETDHRLKTTAWLQLADVIDRLFLIFYLLWVAVCLAYLGYL
jgi:hypothetical protein